MRTLALSTSRSALLPSHDPRDKIASRLRCSGTFFLLLILMPGLASANDLTAGLPTGVTAGATASADPAADPGANSGETLLLEVQVNGHSIGKIGEFTLRHGQLLARASELRDLGFQVPDSLASDPNDLVPLYDLPGFTWYLDQKKQELLVTVSDNRLLPTMLQSNGRAGAEGRRVIESGTGMTLNYDIANTLANGQSGATGSLDLRAFSPKGVVSSEWLAYGGATSNGSGTNTAIRLDTAYTFADVNTLRRYTLGDFITGGLAWTRPVRLEGAQIRSDFSMRPDLVTFPLPYITGTAAVPSTVNVLADGNLVISNQVAAGPFQTSQLPVMSGAGTISMTVTNTLGQQVTLSQPFYASSSLLAPGLQTFAGQAGLVRLNWGSASNDYGKFAGTAIYRRGLTRKFTIEGSAEETSGAIMAGAGGVAQVGNLGVLNFALAASTGSGHAGAQISLGAQRIGRMFSIGASAIIANRNYRDVASLNGDGIPRKQLSAFSSLSLKRFGSAGVAYAGDDQDASPTAPQLEDAPIAHSHVFSANYSVQLHRVSIYLSEFRDMSSSGSGGLQIGVTIPLGRRSSVDISAASDESGQVQVQKSASQIGDWGYDAYVSTGSSDHEFGQVQYKSSVGLFTAGVDSSGGQTTLRLESQGALSFVDKGLFPSNTIYDSFAIVDTSPMPHVHVFQENRDVGRTNSSGRLLVPDLRSFDLNHLAIEATDIPADVTIPNASKEVRPQDRSGVVVKFPIKFSHGALLRLVDEDGVSIPLGSTATLQATGTAVPVGYDGDAYVENLNPHNEITVERMDGRRCTIAFYYRPVPGEIPSIGPLRCLEQK
jgi:outer membrane usher protein